MIIIFDYNRTIYDPETDSLVEGAMDALIALKESGAVLHLVSKREGGRKEKLATLGIQDYFSTIAFVDSKGEAFSRIIGDATDVFVVGDHLYSEIREGNKRGARTIRLKRGKFADLLPETQDDIPWRTIGHLSELREIFLG